LGCNRPGVHHGVFGWDDSGTTRAVYKCGRKTQALAYAAREGRKGWMSKIVFTAKAALTIVVLSYLVLVFYDREAAKDLSVAYGLLASFLVILEWYGEWRGHEDHH
jgi:hypothetical protein